MNPKHETKFHVAVGQEEQVVESPGVTVCEAHQEAFHEVFSSMRSYMSRMQIVWTIGVLSAVAIFYGVTLWTTVTARCNESDARITALKDQATIQAVKLQYIEDTVRELKTGQKETLCRLEELRKELQATNDRRP
jgi:hypothetical protein